MSLALVGYLTGFWGVVMAMLLAPITLVVAPWVAVVKWGTWIPLVITYGGAILGAVLYALRPTSSETFPTPR
jgi:hypothetical protein